MPNLYYIEETERSDPEFVVADSIQEAIDRWKEFVIARDHKEFDEEPELIKLVVDYVIGATDGTP